jgi:hypothetical protein
MKTASQTPEELDRIDRAQELQIAPERSNGSLRSYITIWVVRVDDELFVRAYRGRNASWFRHVLQHRRDRIRAGGVERDVALNEPSHVDHPTIGEAYRGKYKPISTTHMPPIVSPETTAATLQLFLASSGPASTDPPRPPTPSRREEKRSPTRCAE